MPAIALEQERVEAPDPPAMLVVDRVHERLVELVATVRATVLVNPFTALMLIIEVPGAPTLTATLAGFAAIMKSGCAAVVT